MAIPAHRRQPVERIKSIVSRPQASIKRSKRLNRHVLS
jgi:hypothetical protein